MPASDRPTLVLLCGIGEDEALWAPLIAELKDRADCRPMVAHGDSVEAMAEDVLARLPGPVALAGHSLGGYVALAVQRRAPERVARLALLNTSARAEDEAGVVGRRRLLDRLAANGFPAVISTLLSALGGSAEAEAMLLRAGEERFVREQHAAMARPDARCGLAAIAVPVLVIASAGDRVIAADRSIEIAAAIPAASLVVLAGAGHLSPLDAPEAAAAAMRGWLDRPRRGSTVLCVARDDRTEAAKGASAMIDDIGPTSHSFVSQRLRLNYLDWGNPGAPTLILIHGGRDHARSWEWIARALRDQWHIIAPDLRGHGDSSWSADGAYTMPYYICDLAQLVHQHGSEPVTIVAHSLGGAISLRYAGLYPDRVRKLVAIEGLGLSPAAVDEREATGLADRWRGWIEERRALSARLPRRYASLDEALTRMRSENRHLSAEQARHLTIHGVNRNEDGSFSWKFDNYVRSSPPLDLADDELHALWGRITCPTLLAYGNDSWASNPAKDGRARHFRSARVLAYDQAGHWLHHDQFEAFVRDLRAFL